MVKCHDKRKSGDSDDDEHQMEMLWGAAGKPKDANKPAKRNRSAMLDSIAKRIKTGGSSSQVTPSRVRALCDSAEQLILACDQILGAFTSPNLYMTVTAKSVHSLLGKLEKSLRPDCVKMYSYDLQGDAIQIEQTTETEVVAARRGESRGVQALTKLRESKTNMVFVIEVADVVWCNEGHKSSSFSLLDTSQQAARNGVPTQHLAVVIVARRVDELKTANKFEELSSCLTLPTDEAMADLQNAKEIGLRLLPPKDRTQVQQASVKRVICQYLMEEEFIDKSLKDVTDCVASFLKMELHKPLQNELLDLSMILNPGNHQNDLDKLRVTTNALRHTGSFVKPLTLFSCGMQAIRNTMVVLDQHDRDQDITARLATLVRQCDKLKVPSQKELLAAEAIPMRKTWMDFFKQSQYIKSYSSEDFCTKNADTWKTVDKKMGELVEACSSAWNIHVGNSINDWIKNVTESLGPAKGTDSESQSDSSWTDDLLKELVLGLETSMQKAKSLDFKICSVAPTNICLEFTDRVEAVNVLLKLLLAALPMLSPTTRKQGIQNDDVHMLLNAIPLAPVRFSEETEQSTGPKTLIQFNMGEELKENCPGLAPLLENKTGAA